MRKFKMKRVAQAICAAFLIVPGIAAADPITAFALILEATGSQIFAAFVATVASYSTVILSAAAIASNVYSGMDARRRAAHAAADARRAYNLGLKNVGAVGISADPELRLIYGTKAAGGFPVAAFMSDKSSIREDGTPYTRPDGYKHIVVVLGKGPITAISDVLIDEVSIGTLNGSGQPTGGTYFKGYVITPKVVIGSGGYVDLTYAAEVILAAEQVGVLTDYGNTFQDVSGSVSIASGGMRINGPAGATVTYRGTNNEAVIRIQKHLGSTTQTADTFLQSVAPSKWTADHRLQGLAYVVVTLDLEHEPFQGGMPNILFVCDGLKIYDPRKDSTNGGSGAHRYTDPTTWEFSRNNALATADYLCQEVGLAVDPSYGIEWPTIITAANACDVSISLLKGGTTTAGPQYTADGVVSSDSDPTSVLSDFAVSMAGDVVFGAKWYVLAGVWTSPVAALTDDDLDGEISLIQSGTSIEESFTAVRGTFIEKLDGSPSDFDPYNNTTYSTAIGEVQWTDMVLPFTNNRYRAKQICRVRTERNHFGVIIQYPGKLHLWPRRIGQRVTVTSAEYGYVNKPFRIMDWQFGLSSPVTLTLWEDESTSYDYTDAATLKSSAVSGLPDPNIVIGLSSLTLASGNVHVGIQSDGTITPRVYASWPAVTDKYALSEGTGRIELNWITSDGKGNGSASIEATELGYYIDASTKEGQMLVVTAKVYSGRAYSSNIAASIAVVGRSALSSTVASFAGTQIPGGVSFSWTPATFAGYAATEIRVGASWASGTRIFDGRDSPAIWHWPSTGSYTAWAKHRDGYGALTAAASCSFTVDSAGKITFSVLGTDVAAAITLAQNTADDAVGDAAAAQVDADSALNTLGIIANDNILSKGEKGPVIIDWTVISGEFTAIVAQATAYGITTEATNYTTKISALSTYLSGLSPSWSDVSQDTPITGTTFRTRFQEVYDTRQIVLNKIAQIAGTKATWGGVTGPGKPASYATVGKSLGLPFDSWNLNGQTLVDLSDGKVGRTALRLTGNLGAYPNQGNYITIDRSKKYRTRFWARPVATTAGLLYFTLQQFTNDSGANGPINGGRAPYKPSGQTRSGHNSTYGGTDQWGEYSYIWDSADWQSGVQFVRPDFLDCYSGAAGYWEVQDFTFEEVTAVTAAQTDATTAIDKAGAAQTTANNAAMDASSALSTLSDIANDNVLTPVEKPTLILDYGVILAEQSGIDSRAISYGVTTEKSTYDTAVTALATYLATLTSTVAWNDLSGTTTIVGTTIRSKFQDVYITRQALLNLIAQIAGTKADWATGLAGKPDDTDLLNTHTQGSVLVVNHPAGGNFAANYESASGAIKIALPKSWTNTMLRFYVEIYEYQTGTGGGFSATYEVGGYNAGGANWVNAYAKMVGTPASQRTVRFGHDGTYCCVWIGEPGGVWQYPQVIVSNLRAGYSNYTESQWKSGWNVGLDTGAVAGHAITFTEASPLTGASWPLIAGTGRPADNATVGATWGTNLTDQPSDAALLNINQTWAEVLGPGRPADNATADISLAVRGTGLILTGGNSCNRPTGGGSWDADCYSINGFVGGAYCEFVPSAGTASYFMAGLNSDPTTNTSYTSIDFAFYMAGNSTIYCYEGGSSIGPIGTYTAGDVLSLAYDGNSVRYMQNGVSLRNTTTGVSAGTKYHFDSSIVYYGLKNIRVGPLSAVNNIGTSQVVAGSITSRATTTFAGPYRNTGYPTEMCRMNFGPYGYDVDIGMILAAEVFLQLISGPTSMKCTVYLQDNYGGVSPTLTPGPRFASQSDATVPVALGYSYTLTAGASGHIKFMLNDVAGSSYMNTYGQNISMTGSVHKR